MLFSDHFFLVFFFPISLTIYLLLFYFTKSFSVVNILLIILSLLFYLSFGFENLYILLIPLFLDFFAALSLYKTKNHSIRKSIFIAAIVFNVGMLAYFKYTNFFLDSFKNFNTLSRFSKFLTPPKLLPVGISFIIFQRISYLTDTYRKKIKPAQNIVQYGVYAILFPHLIAGPIVRFVDIEKELKKRHIHFQTFFNGIKYFSIGLFLKVVVADQLYILDEHLLTQLASFDTIQAILLLFCFSFRIYFDFLGYSLMAIGLASFFGFSFPENFNSPYIATSLSDFWSRWNISLSNWIRDYIYIPLGGNRKTKYRTAANLVISMSIAGIWHGAGINFILWGFIHGVLLVVEREVSRIHTIRIPIRLKQLITFLSVTLLWLLFRFDTMKDVNTVLSALMSFTFFPLPTLTQKIVISTLPAWFIACYWVTSIKEKNISLITPSLKKLFIFTLLLFFSIEFSLTKRAISFIYFQF